MGKVRTPISFTHYSLLVLLLLYFALALRFALTTPAWQNPDEPAHYNYVAHIARTGTLPVLRMGDYDQAYLQQLMDAGFPPERTIAPLRYEFHQPPLYYLLATPVYRLAGGSLLALRLYSALLGGGVVVLIFLGVRAVFPEQPRLALGAAAFAAFLPMHLSLMAAVNNDALAELLIAGAMLVLLAWLRQTGHAVTERPGREAPRAHKSPATSPPRHLATPLSLIASSSRRPVASFWLPRHPLIRYSLLMGLGFLTKATAYLLLPVGVLTVLWIHLHAPRRGPGPLARDLARIGLPGLLLGLPWWIRNMAVYGPGDFLGLAWHELVVAGQPTTADWIARYGWSAYLERAATFTFKSFWGVFGWMGIFMDGRIYALLGVLSLVLLLGCVHALVRIWPQTDPGRRSQLVALGLLLAGTLASYLWYNLGFVQHQGRYLFPALLSWSLMAALGWDETLRPLHARRVGLLLIGIGVVLALLGPGPHTIDRWTLLIWGGAGAALVGYALLAPRLERLPWVHPLLWSSPWMCLALLDAAIPFMYTG